MQRRWYSRHPNVVRVLVARDAPCVDCGIRLPPQIMELDHVRGAPKEFGFGQDRVTRPDITPDRLEAEIAKCDARCPNCHRLRHFYARPWRADPQLPLEIP